MELSDVTYDICKLHTRLSDAQADAMGLMAVKVAELEGDLQQLTQTCAQTRDLIIEAGKKIQRLHDANAWRAGEIEGLHERIAQLEEERSVKPKVLN